LWLDIGRPEDHADAGQVFNKHIERFLPGSMAAVMPKIHGSLPRHVAAPLRAGNGQAKNRKEAIPLASSND
jgi:hypothetical protein